jgi:hypothetical protein
LDDGTVLAIVVDQLPFTIAIDKSNRALEWTFNHIHRHNITNIPSTAEAATTIRMRSRAISHRYYFLQQQKLLPQKIQPIIDACLWHTTEYNSG